MSISPSSPNSKAHSPSSSPNASVSLIFAFSGSSPYAFTVGGAVGVWCCKSSRETYDSEPRRLCISQSHLPFRPGILAETIIQYLPDWSRPDRHFSDGHCSLEWKWEHANEHTFFLIFPRIWASRFSPSKHWASRRPFPSILITCAYSWPSSRNTSSRLSSSFSFFPRLLFFPPCCRHVSHSGPVRVQGEDLTDLSFVLCEEASVSNPMSICLQTHFRHDHKLWPSEK